MISDDSDFFALGGDSLQAIEFIYLFNRQFERNFDLRDLYRHSRFGDQEKLLAGKLTQKEDIISTVLNDINVAFEHTVKPCQHQSLSTAKAVFLTGATGFLGAHWLASCLGLSSRMLSSVVV